MKSITWKAMGAVVSAFVFSALFQMEASWWVDGLKGASVIALVLFFFAFLKD